VSAAARTARRRRATPLTCPGRTPPRAQLAAAALFRPGPIREEPAMEAEQLNQIAAKLSDLRARTADLRRYL
jgi:hypothetical protein